MRCLVRSVDRTFFDGDAEMIVARSARGEFAIMNGHAPLLAVLVDAPLRIKAEGDEAVFACFGGTLRVGSKGGVEISVAEAVPVEEIDLVEVNRRLSRPEGDDDPDKERLSLLKRIKERYG